MAKYIVNKKNKKQICGMINKYFSKTGGPFPNFALGIYSKKTKKFTKSPYITNNFRVNINEYNEMVLFDCFSLIGKIKVEFKSPYLCIETENCRISFNYVGQTNTIVSPLNLATGACRYTNEQLTKLAEYYKSATESITQNKLHYHGNHNNVVDLDLCRKHDAPVCWDPPKSNELDNPVLIDDSIRMEFLKLRPRRRYEAFAGFDGVFKASVSTETVNKSTPLDVTREELSKAAEEFHSLFSDQQTP